MTSRQLHDDALAAYLAGFSAALELRTTAVESERAAELVESIAVHRMIWESGSAGAIATNLGPSETEQHVIGILAVVAMDPTARDLLAAFGVDGDPTLVTLQRVVYGEGPSCLAFDELGPTGKLRRYGLIERSDDRGPDAHEGRQTWTLARRVLAMLHGNTTSDPALRAIVTLPRILACDQLAVSTQALSATRGAFQADRAVVFVSGLGGLGRRTLLAAVAAEAGCEVLAIDARRLAKDQAQLGKQLRVIARECKLGQRVPLLANLDALVDDKEDRLDLVATELLPLIEGRLLVTSGVQRPAVRWDRPVIAVELSLPSSTQRQDLWRRELGVCSQKDAELLADRYPLAPALVHHAAEATKARATGRFIKPEDIYAGIQAVLEDRLGQYARRITVSQTWDDLVLPQEHLDSIMELLARVRERRQVYESWGFAEKVGKGLGVSALFSGPPGTGKTMVAALIARDLGIELYQVDLGKVVSKWIGETEKNLGALFDAAEAGHAIILFDEADALFGKRTDVKSSNDRYANLETNYLLQRLEHFSGICLLTSNHESSIDPAFQRRLSLHLRFELPDVNERAHLWRAMLPKSAPIRDDVDFASLARRYSMSGGYIRNAALRAAFLAADQQDVICAAHLERAARIEYESMGKIVASPASLAAADGA